jgi:hypothetical protein
VITSAHIRAARALSGIDRKTLARHSGLSLPTIQCREASAGQVRGVVGRLVMLVDALDSLGFDLIGETAASAAGGRGVRLKDAAGPSP